MRYIRNVATVQLDREACVGCGMCANVCPHAVFVVENRKARFVDRDACMECGACARSCPVHAIAVESGVGCAKAILVGALRGTEPDCGGDSCCG